MSEDLKFWGYHLVLDCHACNKKKITDKAYLTEWVKSLVVEIDMVAYGEPIIEHFATHDLDKAGFSIVQLIETSNICAHLVDKNGDMYLDVFSCKYFTVDKVKDHVQKWLKPKNIKATLLTRDAGSS